MGGLGFLFAVLQVQAAPKARNPQELCKEYEGKIEIRHDENREVVECLFLDGNAWSGLELNSLWNTAVALDTQKPLPQAVDRFLVHYIWPSGGKSIWSPGNPFKEYCEQDLHSGYFEISDVDQGTVHVMRYCAFDDGSVISAYTLMTSSDDENNWGLARALWKLGVRRK